MANEHLTTRQARLTTILKRDGTPRAFDATRIVSAIERAGAATGEFGHAVAADITRRVVAQLVAAMGERLPSVEAVQDIVERELIDAGHVATARAYIVYREQHRRLREDRRTFMDVSGSMGSEQKEIVRVESFWIDTWLKHQYKGVDTRYIVHDAVAHEVDRDVFFRIRESGGTIISSAYKLCRKVIDEHYPPDEWNIYIFHFSDGDNWSRDDTHECIEILEEAFLPSVNLFCYGQVESPYGSGQFYYDLEDNQGQKENLVLSKIPDKEAIYDSIKQFLGKGR